MQQPSAGPSLRSKYEEIAAVLADRGLSTNEVFWLFKSSLWVYQLAMVAAIHDYVESALALPAEAGECYGFYLWGGQFFAKKPGDNTVVPYHQDSTYWGLHHTDPAQVRSRLRLAGATRSPTQLISLFCCLTESQFCTAAAESAPHCGR
eukprot:SAG31_NODE_18806_length_622_cov_0.797323_1_plen_148_part_10